jgi:anaerobic selenocysteine-containing dehydrogenase
MWPEKTGTCTNADRTVHLMEKAVDPPGQARSDLDILLDYAQRMGFRDRDGEALLKFTDAESAFEAWKECSRGRLCDYSGMTYDKLRRGSGIQWPCNDQSPEGTERLYEDLRFWSSAEVANTYGKDLITGAAVEELEYRAHDPSGRAIFRAADYHPAPEVPSDDYPYGLSTGRTVYHWHTRTKTGRAPQLRDAAPEVWVEINADDARDLGVTQGSMVEVETPRGRVHARVRTSQIRPGCVFLPFHYGYWDRDGEGPDGTPTAANELTISAWDPVSKQPLFKTAAARLRALESQPGQE